MSLECKYNKLQFGIRISSIEAGKSYASQHRSVSTTKLTAKNPFRSDPFLKNKGILQSVFSVSIGVCAAFLSRRASRNCSKGLEETLLDGVANESAIVPFCSCDRLTLNKLVL